MLARDASFFMGSPTTSATLKPSHKYRNKFQFGRFSFFKSAANRGLPGRFFSSASIFVQARWSSR